MFPLGGGEHNIPGLILKYSTSPADNLKKICLPGWFLLKNTPYGVFCASLEDIRQMQQELAEIKLRLYERTETLMQVS